MGTAGAIALLAYYLVGSLVLAAYLWSPRSLLRPSLRHIRYRWVLFRDILRVGLVGTVSTVATNLAIGITTALVGGFGTAAIAGYGTASRLEYLLVPLVFGFGAPLVAMVGTCMGAGQRERALRATWIGAGMAFAMTEAIGLWAAFFPGAWLSLFNSDPAMIEAAACTCGRWAGLWFLRVGLVLYFASQVRGACSACYCNIARLVVAVTAAGWPCAGAATPRLFIAQGVAL